MTERRLTDDEKAERLLEAFDAARGYMHWGAVRGLGNELREIALDGEYGVTRLLTELRMALQDIDKRG